MCVHMYICLPCGVYPYERMANLFMSTMIFCYAAAVEARLMVRVMHIINGPSSTRHCPVFGSEACQAIVYLIEVLIVGCLGGFCWRLYMLWLPEDLRSFYAKKTVVVENWTGECNPRPLIFSRCGRDRLEPNVVATVLETPTALYSPHY